MKKKTSILKLVNMLSSTSHIRRMQAATLLSSFDEKAVPALLKKLGEPGSSIKQWSIRWYAAVAVSWIGYKAIPFLSESILKDKDWHVRAGSAEVFGMLRREEATPFLAEALDDEHFKVRKYSIYALRRIGKINRSIFSRIELLAKSDPNNEVREVAQEILRESK